MSSPPRSPRDKKLTKSVGEHWACSVLAGLGWAASLTRDGVARTDVLAVHMESGVMVSVQVKAASYSANPSWYFGEKGLLPAVSPHEWYVLVALSEDPLGTPRTFVVPRDHAAAGAWIAYRDWLTDSTAEPGSRSTRPSAARTYSWVFEGYEDRWDQMTLPADYAPVLLPAYMRDLALGGRVGLPPGHPWREVMPEW
ncbi:hypothetical protein B2J88_35920 [Rhodococcus sp. SRB_17]|nr:hypothetical protein [Rhodococcus sp. SRB_17]